MMKSTEIEFLLQLGIPIGLNPSSDNAYVYSHALKLYISWFLLGELNSE